MPARFIRFTALAIALISGAFSLQGQTVSYERLDSLSSVIAALEKQTNGKSYKDLNDRVLELSFPQENFTVWSYNRLATKAVYKKQGATEVLELTEDIDLSKATGLIIEEDYNGVTFIKMEFPEGQLKTETFTDGEPASTVQNSHLEFFCRYGAVNENREFYFEKMFDALYVLSSLLKIEKGLMTESALINEWTDWGKVTMEAFVAKYPESLLTAQAKDVIQRTMAEEAERLRKNQKYISDLAGQFRFKRGLTLSKFLQYNPDAKGLAEKKGSMVSGFQYKSNHNWFNGNFAIGPAELYINNNDVVTEFKYALESGNGAKSVAKCRELMSALKANIDPAHLVLIDNFYSSDGELIVNVPGGEAAITVGMDLHGCLIGFE